MPTNLTISIKGSQKFIKGLTELDKRYRHPLEALTQARDYYLGEIQRNYDTQGSTFGEPWKPLTVATLISKWKRSIGPGGISGGQSMVQTGRMKRSFTATISRNLLVIYNNVEYFLKHQSKNPQDRRIFVFGRRNKTMVLPRRVMMKLDAIRRAKIVSFFGRWMRNNVKASFKTRG